MINFLEKIDSVENPFPKSIRCHKDHVYFFCNHTIKQYSYKDKELSFSFCFEQSIDSDFNQVIFLNQVIWGDNGFIVIVNANKSKDTLFVSLYNSKGICEKKHAIRKRQCFTECQVINSNHIIIHDHQNYLEIYKFSTDIASILEKIYKLSVRLEIPFIFIGIAMSDKDIFLMTAQKDKLLIYQKDLGMINQKTEDIAEKQNPVLEDADITGEAFAPKNAKSHKKIDNLSAFALTIELELPSSFPFNFIHNSGALFFNTNDAVYRVFVNNKSFEKLEIPTVVRLEANDEKSIAFLSMLDIGIFPVQGQDIDSYYKVITSWQEWGIQEKTELIDFQKLKPNVYMVLTPQDCFILDQGQFVKGFEFFPVITQSFRLK